MYFIISFISISPLGIRRFPTEEVDSSEEFYIILTIGEPNLHPGKIKYSHTSLLYLYQFSVYEGL